MVALDRDGAFRDVVGNDFNDAARVRAIADQVTEKRKATRAAIATVAP